MALIELLPMEDDGPEDMPPGGAAIDLRAILDRLGRCVEQVHECHHHLDEMGVPREHEDGDPMTLRQRIGELDAGWRRRLYPLGLAS